LNKKKESSRVFFFTVENIPKKGKIIYNIIFWSKKEFKMKKFCTKMWKVKPRFNAAGNYEIAMGHAGLMIIYEWKLWTWQCIVWHWFFKLFTVLTLPFILYYLHSPTVSVTLVCGVGFDVLWGEVFLSIFIYFILLIYIFHLYQI
jgi:hypothetical protein